MSSLIDLPLATAAPTVFLVGNPNAGKTSLFNALTGLRARTANYPGITVDLRKASLRLPSSGGESAMPIELIDLPGLYSMETTSPEESVAAESIRGNLGIQPSAVVLVLDATNLARNLFLAEEVLQVGCPALVAINMIDAAEAAGRKIDLDKLSERLDCPVVAVSARTGAGLDTLRSQLAALLAPEGPALPAARVSCAQGCSGCSFAARHDWADGVFAESVTDSAEPNTQHVEWLDRLLTAPWIGTALLLAVMLSVFFLIFSLADVPMSAIEGGFGWLASVVDRWIPMEPVNPVLWFAATGSLALAVCAVGFRLGRIPWTRRSTLVACGLAALVAFVPQEDFRSLVLNGMIGGVAGVVVFLPQVCILFFFITLLEDSGYMARAAFVMERLMRRVGLPGKAFVPMLSAHACAIPGIMATRTIESMRDRLVTILVLPLLTCSARLPVYAMLSALLFPNEPLYAALTFAGCYLLGLTAALATAWCLKKTVVPGETAPLVIELPPYRRPTLRNATLTALDRAAVFLRKAGSIILLISVVLWAMATYPKLPEPTAGDSPQQASAELSDAEIPAAESENAHAQHALEYSFAGRAGKLLDPIFAPLGFDWKINVGVVSSFAAREVLVSTLSVVYGIGEQGAEDEAGLVETLRRQREPSGKRVFTTATCFSLLVFYVLAMQCLPTQAVTRRETGSWNWALFQLGYMTVLAYVAALVVFQSLSALGLNV